MIQSLLLSTKAICNHAPATKLLECIVTMGEEWQVSDGRHALAILGDETLPVRFLVNLDVTQATAETINGTSAPITKKQAGYVERLKDAGGNPFEYVELLFSGVLTLPREAAIWHQDADLVKEEKKQVMRKLPEATEEQIELLARICAPLAASLDRMGWPYRFNEASPELVENANERDRVNGMRLLASHALEEDGMYEKNGCHIQLGDLNYGEIDDSLALTMAQAADDAPVHMVTGTYLAAESDRHELVYLAGKATVFFDVARRIDGGDDDVVGELDVEIKLHATCEEARAHAERRGAHHVKALLRDVTEKLGEISDDGLRNNLKAELMRLAAA